MKALTTLCAWSVAFFFTFVPHIIQANDCRCEPVECQPCEVQLGLDFYTDSCNSGKSVKSCKRPKCELPEKPKRGCENLAKYQTQRHVASLTTEDQPQNVATEVEAKKPVGVFVIVRGGVQLIRDEVMQPTKVGVSVFEGDSIKTDENGQAKILFHDKSSINVTPKSALTISNYKLKSDNSRQEASLYLYYGKLRSHVSRLKKQDKWSEKSDYEVFTPAAVAGVRGTEFITTHMEGSDITKVETLSGHVELSGHDRRDRSSIKANQYGSYVLVASNSSAVFGSEDIESFVHRGFLTPVYKITQDQRDLIDISTDYREDGSDIIVAAKLNEPTCSAPKAQYNQCSWVCEGNPAGESRCRTDLVGVRCIRKRCDAGGKWSDETRLPASSHIVCDGTKTVVAPCDY